MSNITGAIYSKLGTLTSLSAYVGTKIYPTLAPETEDAPFLTFVKVSQDVTCDLSGKDGWRIATFDFYAFAPTALTAELVSDLIATQLTGVGWTDSTNGVTVRSSRFDNLVAFYESESRLYRTVTTITFFYTV